MAAEGRRSRLAPEQEASLPTPSAKRRSNGRACITCHQRKVRCDILTKGAPCSNCRSHSSSTCRIYEKKRTRAAQARFSHGNVRIQPRDQQVLTAPATPAEMDTSWADSTVSRLPSRSERTSPVRNDGDGDDGGDGGADNFEPRPDSRSGSSTTRDGECLDEQATRNLVDFIDTEAVKVTEIGENHRLYFIGTEFSNLNYLVRRRSGYVNLDQLHFGSHHLARRVSRVPAEALKLPEKPLADRLVKAYFAHINPGWPIVDEVDFMERYNSTDPKKGVPLPLLHAVFLVGAHASASEIENYKSLKAVFLHRAKLLIDARFEEDRKTYVQVALLLTWSCDSLEDIVSNSWYWIGFAARTAHGLGMHRDSYSSRMTLVTKREFVRLWWVLYQFDVLLSVSYGRPQAIHLDESDTPTLQEHHFEGIPGANIAFVTEFTRLCVIFSKSMREVLSLRATAAEKNEARRKADEALAQFITQLPESLRLPQPEASKWQSFLHLTYHNFLLLLHRPPAHHNPRQHPPESGSDLSICGDAVANIASIYESMRTKATIGNLAIPSMYIVFTALVYVSSELTSTNPLVVAKSVRLLDSLILSLKAMSKHWLFAISLLRLFQDRAVWGNQRGHQGRRLQDSSVAESDNRPADGSHTEGPEFSLRPHPMSVSSGAAFPPAESPGMTLTPSSMVSGQGPLYTGQVNSDINMSMAPEGNSRDLLQGQTYAEGFDGSSLNMQTDSLDMLPFPLALDFLLAGMGNEYECL